MNRRTARLRREYLYKRSLAEREGKILDKKRRVKEAITSKNKTIPTELRSEAIELQKSLEFDGIAKANLVDDEYAGKEYRVPKIVITTSREPSSRLKQFSKEMKLIFPNSYRRNRGNTVIKSLIEDCRQQQVTDLIVLHEHRGEPDGLLVSHLPYGPTAYFGIKNAVLRHDINTNQKMSETFPHIICDGFTTSLGERVSTILKYLFPVPKEASRRIISFSNRNNYISFRHHVYRINRDKRGPMEEEEEEEEEDKNDKENDNIELIEVGPRFEMRLYQIKLGTPDQIHADNEWTLRPYQNTALTRQFL